MPHERLRTYQNQKLLETLRWVWQRNEFFQNRFAEVGLTMPDDFAGIEQLHQLPLCGKDDFRKTYPLGMCCVENEAIREMHMSSGSTGSAVVMPYTEHDLDQWAECMARCFVMAGAQAGDPIQITPSFGLFNGGFGMYHGARKAGLFVIPTGSGNTERQIRLAQDFGTKICRK